MCFIFPETRKEVADLLWLVGVGAKILFQQGKRVKQQHAGRGNGGLEEDGPLKNCSSRGDNVHY